MSEVLKPARPVRAKAGTRRPLGPALARASAAWAGGWLAASAWAALIAQAGWRTHAVVRSDAATLGTLVSVVVYAAMVMSAYAVRSGTRAWAVAAVVTIVAAVPAGALWLTRPLVS